MKVEDKVDEYSRDSLYIFRRIIAINLALIDKSLGRSACNLTKEKMRKL